MKIENLIEKLKSTCNDKIESVILYGSAAAGDRSKNSDYNILIVTTDLELETLKKIAPISKSWEKAKNPTPLLFSKSALQDSTDVFPIELLDIHDCRKVLMGSDIISEIEVRSENLRLEIERELRGKLIQLRQRYIATNGKPKDVINLMCQTQSTFLVLFRAALRLFDKYVPVKKMNALSNLEKHLKFEAVAFRKIAELKDKKIKLKDQTADELFSAYMQEILTVTKAVDQFKCTNK